MDKHQARRAGNAWFDRAGIAHCLQVPLVAVAISEPAFCSPNLRVLLEKAPYLNGFQGNFLGEFRRDEVHVIGNLLGAWRGL